MRKKKFKYGKTHQLYCVYKYDQLTTRLVVVMTKTYNI